MDAERSIDGAIDGRRREYPVTGIEHEIAEVLRQHGGLIVRIARAHERDRGRCEELVQDIQLAVWQALPRFRAQANLRTYVARIAQNRAVSHVAREARLPIAAALDPFDDVLPSTEQTPEDAALHADRRQRLEQAVQELPLGLRLTVTLALEGFSPDEVATVLGVSPSAAAVRLHRAKTILQEQLKDRHP
jgi:RNA polymerase sigma-70 factor (ECF subfamily)